MATNRKRQESTRKVVSCLLRTPWSSVMTTTSKIMITVFVSEINPVSQKFYDHLMERVYPCRLSCTCGCVGSMIRYGSYHRHVKSDGTNLRLKVQRVLCCSCGRSHALLPSALVPYSQIPLKDQVSVIEAYESGEDPSSILETNPEMDDRTPFKLIRIYLALWRERLRSERIPLRPLAALPERCLSFFGKQFMQIKNTPNIFFSPPT